MTSQKKQTNKKQVDLFFFRCQHAKHYTLEVFVLIKQQNIVYHTSRTKQEKHCSLVAYLSGIKSDEIDRSYNLSCATRTVYRKQLNNFFHIAHKQRLHCCGSSCLLM